MYARRQPKRIFGRCSDGRIHFLGVDFGSVAQWRPYQGPSPATVASANRFSRVAEGFSTS